MDKTKKLDIIVGLWLALLCVLIYVCETGLKCKGYFVFCMFSCLVCVFNAVCKCSFGYSINFVFSPVFTRVCAVCCVLCAYFAS